MPLNLIPMCSTARECMSGPQPASFETIERISDLLARAGFRITYEGLFGVKFAGTSEQLKDVFAVDADASPTFSVELGESDGELGKLIARIYTDDKTDASTD
jgi:hypothetical protein